MTYNRTTWQSGDTITSEKLNNIESGIELASKQVTTTRIINDSTREVACYSNFIDGVLNFALIAGVLYIDATLDPTKVISSGSTSAVVTLPVASEPVEWRPPLIGLEIQRLDSLAVLTSDGFDISYDDNSWWCAIAQPPIPDNLSITISDPPLGEERTISIQSGSYISGLPESVTGRVNEWVHIDHVSSGDWQTSALTYYDASTPVQDGVDLFMTGLGDDCSDLTLSFRIPSTDVVSDTGYIQINGSR